MHEVHGEGQCKVIGRNAYTALMAMVRQRGQRLHANSGSDGVAAVEILARGLISHPRNAALRQQIVGGAVTPLGLSDGVQRIVFGMAVLDAMNRRGPREQASVNSRKLRWHDLRLRLEELGERGLITQRPTFASCEMDDDAIQSVWRALLGRDEDAMTFREIGAMHEQLLGAHAEVDLDATDPADRFRLVPAQSANRRRRSGAFYTADALVQHLLDVTLRPMMDEATSGLHDERAVEAILRLRVCDPSCGVGHFLIAAAHMMAARIGAIRGDAPGAALRDVIERCIFGVDLNPLAVELCRSMLWLDVADDAFDASVLREHIKCGHALNGAATVQIDGQSIAAARLRSDAWCEEVIARSGKREDAATHRFFHWHVEFPAVFGSEVAGFDVIVGNPPFLNQLESETAIARDHAAILRARSNGAVQGYADVASAFLLLATEIVRRGGRIALVQPQSLLAARDAAAIRKALLARTSLRSMWVANEHMFDAHVFTCAPMLVQDEALAGPLTRYCGSNFTQLPSVEVDTKVLVEQDSWASLIADATGVPRFSVNTSSIVGDVADATADFRDQYYGLEGCLIDDADLSSTQRMNLAAFPPLITSGLIDLAENRWRMQPTRVLKRRWLAPRVDRAQLERDPALARWMQARLVPKILVATQTRIIEVIVDEAGELVPSVPVLTVTVHDPKRLWHVAAALASPVCAAIALQRFGGTAMTSDAIKLSARQVLQLPLPSLSKAWDRAVEALRTASDELLDGCRRRIARIDMADSMNDAFDVPSADRAILQEWWAGRLARRAVAATPCRKSRVTTALKM